MLYKVRTVLLKREHGLLRSSVSFKEVHAENKEEACERVKNAFLPFITEDVTVYTEVVY